MWQNSGGKTSSSSSERRSRSPCTLLSQVLDTPDLGLTVEQLLAATSIVSSYWLFALNATLDIFRTRVSEGDEKLCTRRFGRSAEVTLPVAFLERATATNRYRCRRLLIGVIIIGIGFDDSVPVYLCFWVSCRVLPQRHSWHQMHQNSQTSVRDFR